MIDAGHSEVAMGFKDKSNQPAVDQPSIASDRHISHRHLVVPLSIPLTLDSNIELNPANIEPQH